MRGRCGQFPRGDFPTQEVGAIMAQPTVTMPVRHKYRPRIVRQAHIKYVGITKLTETRYNHAVKSFFEWRKSAEFATAVSYAELDYQLSESVNYLYQDERPTG